jgi:hypothetical protein
MGVLGAYLRIAHLHLFDGNRPIRDHQRTDIIRFIILLLRLLLLLDDRDDIAARTTTPRTASAHHQRHG